MSKTKRCNKPVKLQRKLQRQAKRHLIMMWLQQQEAS